MKGAAVIVIGAGVTGLSTAWWLARAGVDVLVLEKSIVAWGASGRNGGGTTHHQSPLFKEEQRLWPVMDELLGYPTEFRPHRIRIALNQAQMDIFAGGVSNIVGQGFRADWLDTRQVCDLVPLAGNNVVGGVYMHCGGHANPQRVSQAYAWAIEDLGGRILQGTTVTGFERVSGKVSSVVTDRGTFGCDTLVIASGPQTSALSHLLDASIPTVNARAEMLVTEPLEPMPIGGVDGNGLYGRQALRGNLVYGGGPHEWLADGEHGEAARASSPLSANIAKRVAQLFPKAAHARVIRSWAGVVENTPDGRPIIDFLPGTPNALVATMSGVGFGLSPASGRAISQLATHGECDFADLSTFRLDRFKALEPEWQASAGWLSPHSPEIPANVH